MCGLFTLVAVVGKFGGGAISAKLAGESWKDSLSIGTLMNTRGLMELVVLNIGYDMGILPPTIFVMLVIMALVTTFMTSPILSIIDKVFTGKANNPQSETPVCESKYKILICFGLPETGKRLFNISGQLFANYPCGIDVTALHLTQGTDTNPAQLESFKQSSFNPISEKANRMNIPFHLLHKVTNNVTDSIIEESAENGYDLVLVGAGVDMSRHPEMVQPRKYQKVAWFRKLLHKNLNKLTPLDLMQDKSDKFVEEVDKDLGIYINRDLGLIERVIVVITDPSDLFLIKFAEKIISNSRILIQLILTSEFRGHEDRIPKRFAETHKQRVALIRTHYLNEATYTGVDLMLVSYKGWATLKESPNHEIEKIPSTLIIHHPYKKETD